MQYKGVKLEKTPDSDQLDLITQSLIYQRFACTKTSKLDGTNRSAKIQMSKTECSGCLSATVLRSVSTPVQFSCALC